MSDDAVTIETSPPKPRLWLRRLRIAVSVFFAVVTVALCVLWVRSYRRCDYVARNNGIYTQIGISNGGAFYFCSAGMGQYVPIIDWTYFSQKNQRYEPRLAYSNDSWSLQFEAPLWFLALGTAIVSGAFGWRTRPCHLVRQFSLRTLLIATTLVAVVLGWVMWMLR